MAYSETAIKASREGDAERNWICTGMPSYLVSGLSLSTVLASCLQEHSAACTAAAPACQSPRKRSSPRTTPPEAAS